MSTTETKIAIGTTVIITKGKFKGFTGTVKEVIGQYAYANFPERAALGLNTEFSIKITDLKFIK